MERNVEERLCLEEYFRFAFLFISFLFLFFSLFLFNLISYKLFLIGAKGQWMYGGSEPDDEAAMSASAHELKGLVAIDKCSVDGYFIHSFFSSFNTFF